MTNNYTRILTRIIILFFSLIFLSNSICRNSSDNRYDLTLPSELINYNSVCFEYSKRTCCSAANFDSQARRITKILGSSFELSHECRRMLTNMICSSCDADIGENIKEGVCTSYCSRIYDNCKHDYFTADSNNQLRVCREDDIICSRIEDIVAEKGKKHICNIFQQKVGSRNCWDGQISARTKGRGPNKVTIPIKSKPKKKKTATAEPWISKSKLIIIFLACVAAAIILYKYYSHRRRLWKRQIRNL